MKWPKSASSASQTTSKSQKNEMFRGHGNTHSNGSIHHHGTDSEHQQRNGKPHTGILWRRKRETSSSSFIRMLCEYFNSMYGWHSLKQQTFTLKSESTVSRIVYLSLFLTFWGKNKPHSLFVSATFNLRHSTLHTQSLTSSHSPD